jgi:hypothetical protein
MDKREFYTAFEVDGRQFRAGKFDAMTGCYVAMQLMQDVLPAGLNALAGIPVPNGGKTMSKEDFAELQKACLSVCEELLPSGPTLVMNPNGSFGVIGLDHDAPTVMILTVRALAWNVKGFFTESALSSMADALKTIFPPDVQTLMNGFMHLLSQASGSSTNSGTEPTPSTT